MSTVARGVAIAAAMAFGPFGCQQTKKLTDEPDSAPAAVPVAAAAASAAELPAECDAFLAQYTCWLTKSGRSAAEAHEMRAAWLKSSALPDKRASLASTCAKQSVTQADNFRATGCLSATAAPGGSPAAKAASPLGGPSSSAVPAKR